MFIGKMDWNLAYFLVVREIPSLNVCGLKHFFDWEQVLEVGAGYTTIFILQALRDNFIELTNYKKLQRLGKATCDTVPWCVPEYLADWDGHGRADAGTAEPPLRGSRQPTSTTRATISIAGRTRSILGSLLAATAKKASLSTS